MKKLVFAALLCGGIAQLGTGCIIVSDDDPIVDVLPSTITAEWYLVSGDANDPAGCPAEATTMEVITMDATGYQIVDKFYCGDNGGVVERDPGTYTIWTRLTDDTSTITYAQSFTTDVTVAAELNTDASFTFSLDRGSFSFSWNLTYDNAPSSCDAIAVGNVAITSTLVGDANTFYDDEAACADYQMLVPGMVLGTYTVSISILDEAGSGALYTAPALADKTLEYGNHLHDLGNIELALTSI